MSMNVLIVRPDGIGDVLLSLPVATQLKRLVPGVTVGFLTSPTVAPLLDRHPDVDYVRAIRFTDPFKKLRLAFSQRVEAAIFLKPFRRLMWAAWVAGVPIRVATRYRWYSPLANRHIYEHRSEFSKHESEYNVEMLKGLGLRPQPTRPPVLTLTEAERAAGASQWSGLPRPRVVIHPGGVSARRWRLEQYRDLVVTLTDRGYGVVLTGSDQERTEFGKSLPMSTALPAGVVDLMGHLSLRELMSVIANAHVVVSGATGPAHLAAALGIPTLTLFDPRRNNLPVRWKPLGLGALLRPDVPTCEKCIGEACPYWDCLDRFTVEKVIATIDKIVENPSPLTVLHI
ncbi:MAG TPA: glycosyltransferase family 9 protein [Nitrospira sp.]|nr:glycosyltransferase family 9 protein [Nitrospira sp.]